MLSPRVLKPLEKVEGLKKPSDGFVSKPEVF